MDEFEKKIKMIVKEYLTQNNTDYAILIDGDWGCGKTYFWKNVLEKFISRIEYNDNKSTKSFGFIETMKTTWVKVKHDTLSLFCTYNKSRIYENRIYYRTIYVSLYGVNDIEEIGKSIIIERLPKLFRTKSAKFIGELFKKITSLLVRDIYSDIPSRKIKKYLNFNNYVICFDDLERSNLEFDKLMGYINSFVEHENIKVLIMANEDEISKWVVIDGKVVDACSLSKNIVDENRTRYFKTKEKLIGKTILYDPNYSDIFANLISQNIINNKVKIFLNSKIDIISDFYKIGDTRNLRIIKQSLLDFEKLFSQNNFKYFDEHGLKIFLFLLSIAIERSKGNIKNDTFKDVIGSIDSKYWKNNSDSYLKYLECIKKYYHNFMGNYEMFISILIMFKNGLFEEKPLETELQKKYHEISKEINILKDDLIKNYRTLSDDDFYNLSENILELVENGEYSIYDLPKLFYFYSFFSKKNIIKHNIKEVLKKFKIGIKHSLKKSIYTDYFVVDFIYEKDKDIDYFMSIFFKYRAYLKKISKKEESQRIINYLDNDINAFCREIVPLKENGLIVFSFYFYDLKTKEVIEKIKNMSNEDLSKINIALIVRYDYTNKDIANDENKTFKELHKELETYISEEEINKKHLLRIYLLKELNETFKKYSNKK